MNPPLFVSFPGNDTAARRIAETLGAQHSPLGLHRFPDEETLVKFDTPVAGRNVVLFCPLDRPDPKIVPLLFAAGTARELGATRVGLVAPYLAYMRQDDRFEPGQAVSAQRLAGLIDGMFDWLITVDPHLHRVSNLSDLYAIPARAIRSAPAIASWIAREVGAPLIIGPDSESVQWVSDVARLADAPYAVWRKTRRGDEDVVVSGSDDGIPPGRTPVLVDDIISSGRTMAKAVSEIVLRWKKDPVCIGVHAIFAAGAERALADAGAARIVTTNTIAHATNAIDVSSEIAKEIDTLIR